jgi:hypothetical protein
MITVDISLMALFVIYIYEVLMVSLTPKVHMVTTPNFSDAESAVDMT